jgi:hypothetical protein
LSACFIVKEGNRGQRDTYVGADPWVGSYRPFVLFLVSLGNPSRLALGRTPSVPTIEPAWSEIMSPNVLSARMTPFKARGLVARISDAESASWCTSFTWGYSVVIVFSTTRRHSREEASTLALSREITGHGGLWRRAISADRRVMRSISCAL